MRDRLQDLQEGAPPVEEKKEKKPKKNEKKDTSVAPSEDQMAKFFQELADIKDQIASIKNSITEVKNLHDKALNNVISEQQSSQTAKELDAVMDRTNKESSMVRNKLKAMDAANKKLQASDPESSDVKIRISQHGVLTKNFLDVMLDYKKIQEMYQDKYKDRMQRQALIVKPNATPDEIEKMVEGGEAGQVFAKQIMNTGQRQEARKALEDIQNRHRDVVKIEKSLLELQQLFMDMAVLVAAQGEMLNQIAVNVRSAVDDTEAGVQALTQATKTQKRTRKKMCIILFLIIGIVAVCVAIPSALKAVKII